MPPFLQRLVKLAKVKSYLARLRDGINLLDDDNWDKYYGNDILLSMPPPPGAPGDPIKDWHVMVWDAWETNRWDRIEEIYEMVKDAWNDLNTSLDPIFASVKRKLDQHDQSVEDF
jgi:hypothetical protein